MLVLVLQSDKLLNYLLYIFNPISNLVKNALLGDESLFLFISDINGESASRRSAQKQLFFLFEKEENSKMDIMVCWNTVILHTKPWHC